MIHICKISCRRKGDFWKSFLYLENNDKWRKMAYQDRWYVIDDKKHRYLHHDGTWRRSTVNEEGEETGFFFSKSHATDTLSEQTSNN